MTEGGKADDRTVDCDPVAGGVADGCGRRCQGRDEGRHHGERQRTRRGARPARAEGGRRAAKRDRRREGDLHCARRRVGRHQGGPERPQAPRRERRRADRLLPHADLAAAHRACGLERHAVDDARRERRPRLPHGREEEVGLQGGAERRHHGAGHARQDRPVRGQEAGLHRRVGRLRRGLLRRAGQACAGARHHADDPRSLWSRRRQRDRADS